MVAWCISDPHGKHHGLTPPIHCDTVICAGDMTNNRLSDFNWNELYSFYLWFAGLPIKNKIVIAGNHDVMFERGKDARLLFQGIEGLTYLEHSATVIDGICIFGSPYTPSFGTGWAFNKDRGKLGALWDDIPMNTEILVTHGPPKGILDLSYDRGGQLEYCGDKTLLNKVKTLPVLKYHVFGHIHNMEGCLNQGTRTHGNLRTTFVNASVVNDGEFDKGPSSNGVIIEI